ncbi:mimivirus translation initiation factor 2 subunit alpha [Tupanvirus deep ocean]|uniref:Mimivirus translation initiation factor 2 subunit alpha n=2 Tax=Tupanvirus TaxID=2094720 RepID=A0AC62A9V8_9VIRU|nr:mimivirus translation initiation factor 2 subunit alpha [Tupanvirus deep ocean]QKU34567.1 mimivirus translation initiation factor 2 subunit alpha [Tupanvirus deep ocean]
MRPTKYPNVNDITMVVPTKITDLGVYVQLIEYNNIEGLIILSDLSKSRFKSINKVVKVGKRFAAAVQTFDEKSNNITLSKKIVSEDESKQCENNYKTLKYIYDLVNFFMRKIQKEHNITITPDTVYETFIWPLSNDAEFLIFALKSASKDFNKVYENKLENIEPIWIECFKEVLSLKFKNKEVLLEAILEITCYETGGINIIKNTLLEANIMANEQFPYKIKLVKSPYYSITIRTNNQEPAVKLITNVINTIKMSLEKNGASIKIVKMPEIVLDKEFEPEDSDSDSASDCDSDCDN